MDDSEYDLLHILKKDHSGCSVETRWKVGKNENKEDVSVQFQWSRQQVMRFG